MDDGGEAVRFPENFIGLSLHTRVQACLLFNGTSVSFSGGEADEPK